MGDGGDAGAGSSKGGKGLLLPGLLKWIAIGLAAVIIGEVLGNALIGKRMNFALRLGFVAVGGIIYYLVIVIVLWLKLDSNYLKLLTAAVVAIFLAVPNIQTKMKTSFSRAGKRSVKSTKEAK